MSAECRDLELFWDQRLDPEDAARFRDHLVDCEACQARLDELVQLGVAARAIPEVAAARYVAQTSEIEAARRRRRTRWIVGLSMAAVVLPIPLLIRACNSPSRSDDLLVALMARRSDWPIDDRVARPALDRPRHRTTHLGAPQPVELPLRELTALDERGDEAGKASLYLLAGHFAEAEQLLARVVRSADSESDRAVAARGNKQLEEAYRHVGAALALRPDHPQATWNEALVLRDLGLGLMAAASFDRVAAMSEPGWAAAARDKALLLREEITRRREAWSDFDKKGRALLDGGEPFSAAEIALRPGLARHYFYHAVRSASARERALALLPMARQLDELSGRRDALLQGLVQRIAARDFQVRAPLAAVYRDYYFDRKVAGGPGWKEYLGQLREAGEDDLLLGALLWDPELAGHLDEIERLAAGDPWHEATVAYERARDEHRRGLFSEQEQRLLGALERCHAERIEYRCGYLERRLSELYYHLNRNSEAQRYAAMGMEHARATGEWGMEILFLQDLAATAEERRNYAMARAFLGEIELRQSGTCTVERYVGLERARIALDELQREVARWRVWSTKGCGKPLDPSAIEVLAGLAHWGLDTAESEQAAAGLRSWRAAAVLRPGEPALIDEIEGRILVERDRAAGIAQLDRALAAIDRLPGWDPDRIEARPRLYSAKIVDAARRGAWAEAMALFARDVGIEQAPARCAVGISVDFDRLVLASVDGAGHAAGALTEGVTVPPAASSVIPESLRAALSACEVVDVYARPPYAGQGDLLPPEVAWRHRVGRGSESQPPPAPRRLIVTAPLPPGALELPSLQPWKPGVTDGAELLIGAEARPAAVLAAMTSAGEVLFHAHGLVDLRVADASFLALSPDDKGRFALTAGDVRRQPLTGHPTVFLASCRAAETSPGRLQPWSLPAAFIEAGARAVFASPEVLSDEQIRPFFADLAKAIRAGVHPAVALREARKSGGATGKAVLLFE